MADSSDDDKMGKTKKEIKNYFKTRRDQCDEKIATDLDYHYGVFEKEIKQNLPTGDSTYLTCSEIEEWITKRIKNPIKFDLDKFLVGEIEDITDCPKFITQSAEKTQKKNENKKKKELELAKKRAKRAEKKQRQKKKRLCK
eukprot:236123_1